MIQKISTGKIYLLILLFPVFLFAFTGQSPSEQDKVQEYFHAVLTQKANDLLNTITRMDKLADAKSSSKDYEELKEAFRQSREEYKSIETFIIHFFPGDAIALNLPDMIYPEEDDEVSILVNPHGFQVLERLIYEDSSPDVIKARKFELAKIRKIAENWPRSIQMTDFPEREIFEAAQQGMIRIFLVGLSNRETPHAHNAINEAIAYVNSLEDIISLTYKEEPLWMDSLQREFLPVFDQLKAFLQSQLNKETPDYFTLFSQYYIPASEVLGKVRHVLVKGNFFNTTAVNLEVRSIFDPGAFNTYFFLPGKKSLSSDELRELGRVLFFDPALSSNNERACASCHRPSLAFSDGMPVSRSFQKGVMLHRNAPGLINSVLQRKLFHDGRSFTFENQASEVINNPDEMHSDFDKVAEKLRQSEEYKKLFSHAFRNTEDTQISARSILMAIAEYERSLVALNSRFDKTIRGSESLLSSDEKSGFNIFMGKGKCASCHFPPLFSGTVPPEYAESEMEVLGVPANSDLEHPVIDADKGRQGIIPMEIYHAAFKTPGLRNLALTGPYMHNGVFASLAEVVEFYDRGGGAGIGLDVPNQTLPTDRLNLSPAEKSRLVAFLSCLTDTVNMTTLPAVLPSFENNPDLNLRKPGGVY